MLKLYSKDSKQKAEGNEIVSLFYNSLEILRKNSAQIYDILETRTLMLNLQGLEYMNGKVAIYHKCND